MRGWGFEFSSQGCGRGCSGWVALAGCAAIPDLLLSMQDCIDGVSVVVLVQHTPLQKAQNEKCYVMFSGCVMQSCEAC
jgi:hypothetical protein